MTGSGENSIGLLALCFSNIQCVIMGLVWFVTFYLVKIGDQLNQSHLSHINCCLKATNIQNA